MSLREMALAYATEYGWHVFPLAPGSKKPFEGSRGLLEATTDPEQIEAWWTEHPDANIGIATGPSGLAVMDGDFHSPKWNASSVRWWNQLPPTLTVSTPRGGEHRIYKGDIRSSSHHLAPGVDTRGEGGYIVAPPSLVGGRAYEWTLKMSPTEVPEFVPSGLNGPKAVEEDPQHGTKYGLAVLNGEAGRLALRTEEGERNSSLFASAVRVFELVKAGEIEKDHATNMLRRAVAGWEQHADPFTSREVQGVLESAWKRAEARPPGDSTNTTTEELPTQPRYMSIEELGSLPPARWLIPGVLPEGISLLYGKHASGKTFIALDFALTIASFGGVVIYCAGEGVSGLHSRVEAWTLHHPGMDPKGFVVLANDAFPRLTVPSAVARFHADVDMIARDYGAPTLVVVDTWRRALAPQSVNGDETVAQAFMALDDIRSKYGTNALILHHPRKGGPHESSPPEAGSGSLQDNVDFTWKLWSVDDDHKTLYNTKSKDFEEQSSLRFTLKPVGNSLVASPSVSELMI
jgi:hypothetical protein